MAGGTSRARPGGLAEALITHGIPVSMNEAAMSASRTKNTYLAARYRRIAARRGPVRAVVAIERTILTAIWNMLTYHVASTDLGGDYYTRRDPVRAKHRAIRPLESLGYQVTVQPATA